MGISAISQKVVKCAKCGQDIVIKSFRPAPCKHTKDGYICKKCAEAGANADNKAQAQTKAAPKAQAPKAEKTANKPAK